MDFGRRKDFAGNIERSGYERKAWRGFFFPKKILIATVFFFILFIFVRYAWREMRFRYIVIHHTASDIGNMDYYRRLHVNERGWPDIAYHFVINNGTYNTAMGQVEESSLWTGRSINYSTKVSYINYFGIAISLIGNFENHPVPPLQWESLVNLATTLSKEYGIPPERIVAHREIWETACPGKYFDILKLRKEVAKNISQENQ